MQFTPAAIEKIRTVVRRVLAENRNDPPLVGTQQVNYDRYVIFGLLTAELERGGTSTLLVRLVNPSGGLGATTGEEYTIVDANQLSADITLPAGCACSAIRVGAYYKLLDYDCDLEDQS